MGVSTPTEKVQMYITAGFSYYEFNDTLGIVACIYYPFESNDYQYARFNASCSDVRKILFGNVVSSSYHEVSSQTLYFPKAGKPYVKENSTYREEYRYQSMIDDNTIF